MSIINDYLDYISTANYGSDVREAIVSSIRECYKDATGHPDSVAALVQEYIDREESIDDKISLLTGLYNSLGDIVYSYDYTNLRTDIRVPSGEYELVDRIILGPGKWIIQVVSSFFEASNAAPDKATFYLSLSNTLNTLGHPTPIGEDYRLDEYAGTILNSSVTNFHFIRMISLIEETTIYMWIKHPGKSNDYTVNPHMIAMKIGESTPSDGTSLADQVVENTENISILDGKVATNISDISTLDSDVSTLQDDVDDIEDEIADIKADFIHVKQLSRLSSGILENNLFEGTQYPTPKVSGTLTLEKIYYSGVNVTGTLAKSSHRYISRGMLTLKANTTYTMYVEGDNVPERIITTIKSSDDANVSIYTSNKNNVYTFTTDSAVTHGYITLWQSYSNDAIVCDFDIYIYIVEGVYTNDDFNRFVGIYNDIDEINSDIDEINNDIDEINSDILNVKQLSRLSSEVVQNNLFKGTQYLEPKTNNNITITKKEYSGIHVLGTLPIRTHAYINKGEITLKENTVYSLYIDGDDIPPMAFTFFTSGTTTGIFTRKPNRVIHFTPNTTYNNCYITLWQNTEDDGMPLDNDIFIYLLEGEYDNSYFRNEDSDSVVDTIVDNQSLTTKVKEFCALFDTGADIESFLFFTDSHYLEDDGGEEDFKNGLIEMGRTYNNAPVDFCIYGGDIVTSHPENPLFYFSEHDRLCKAVFGNDTYFPVAGNHDYYHYLDQYKLSTQEIINIFFRKDGKAYYSREMNHTTFYFLDTGSNRTNDFSLNVPMDEYKWTQIDWLGEKLKNDDPLHSVIVMHIILNNTDPASEFLMFQKANELCYAYNSRTSITLNSKTYDFTNCTGKVEFFLGGHMHYDANSVKNNIPYIIRRNTHSNWITTFDLVLCDWSSDKVYFKRIGDGNDLTIALS